MSTLDATSADSSDEDTPIVSDSASEFIDALDEILLPDEGGDVRFGALNEPLKLSQIEGITSVRHGVAEGANIGHIVQPGGVGKTREAIAMAHAMHRHGRNTLYVVPSQQAVQDFADKARELCPDMDVGTVYQVEKRIGRLTFITYASLLRCILGRTVETEAHEFEEQEADNTPSITNGNRIIIDPKDYNLVIWDEAHKYLTAHAQQLVHRFSNAINIALTATPRYYEGKEVAHVFGNTLHELDLPTAIERKEISEFRNLLITTDIHTGLALSSPDQEESAEVARAIDIPNRNRIFPDLYEKAAIDVNDKKYTLLGEPTIVFGASINHVHDLAQAFNDALMPALKNDEKFRDALRAKGIDPDAVEQIAAPIHSTGTEAHEPMSLEERNALVNRYHERKVLVLAATSVLQQSFDSPITSVVIDSVPRQTYVGVGQAGMRALRYLQNKEMAFIINTQDADHPSLTFLDFQLVRGREEGVAMELKHTNPSSGQRTPRVKNTPANYEITYGASLVDLAERRRMIHESSYYFGLDNQMRHFTAEGYQRVNALILGIQYNDQEAVRTFLETIQPWIEYVCKRLQIDRTDEDILDDDILDYLIVDILFKLINSMKERSIPNWSRFSVRFQSELRRQYERALQLRNHVFVDLEDEVLNPEARISGEPQILQLHETIPSDIYPANYQQERAEISELHTDLERALKHLSYRERETLKLYYGFGDGYSYSTKEIADIFKITEERAGNTRARGVKKLSKSLSSKILEAYVDDANEWEEKERMKKLQRARGAQSRRNYEILAQFESDLLAVKHRLSRVFWGLSYRSRHMLVEERHVNALCDFYNTMVDGLFAALEDDVIDQLRDELQRLQVPSNLRERFHNGIANLRNIMRRFRQMGGRPTYEIKSVDDFSPFFQTISSHNP